MVGGSQWISKKRQVDLPLKLSLQCFTREENLAEAATRYLVVFTGRIFRSKCPSTSLDVRVYKNGSIHYQEYRRGTCCRWLKDHWRNRPHRNNRPLYSRSRNLHGNDWVWFWKLNKRIQELALLNRGLRISLTDKREGLEQEKHYHYEGGILVTLNTSMKTKMSSLKPDRPQMGKWMILLLK